MLSFTLILLLIGVISNIGEADECKTPNNEIAQCISLYSCPILLNAPSDPTKLEFVRQSNCGGTAMEPMVCCGSQSNFSTPKNNQKFQELLPNTKICGRQHSDEYFSNVNDTKITEFPWMALISYKSRHYPYLKSGFICSGSLINKKYVLTAGSCTHNPYNEPLNVTLGEYYTGNETDCIKDGHVIECNDRVLDFAIEKALTHPEYRAPYISGWENVPPIFFNHDIGLIRLNGSVDYTEYIRPVCLPLPGSERPKVGNLLATSGWQDDVYHANQLFKRRKYINLISNEECKEKYRKQDTIIPLQEYHICGLSLDSNVMTSLKDKGSPVMFSHKLKWQQKGIICTAPSLSLNYPDIYTNVEYYLDWIEENIEP